MLGQTELNHPPGISLFSWRNAGYKEIIIKGERNLDLCGTLLGFSDYISLNICASCVCVCESVSRQVSAGPFLQQRMHRHPEPHKTFFLQDVMGETQLVLGRKRKRRKERKDLDTMHVNAGVFVHIKPLWMYPLMLQKHVFTFTPGISHSPKTPFTTFIPGISQIPKINTNKRLLPNVVKRIC